MDESHSRHFDLVGGGKDPWSVDLVVEATSCILVAAFGCDLIALIY
jgi:hypothetical protein